MEATFEPTSQNFGDNFVDYIAEANRSKLIDKEQSKLFRDKGNECVILLLQKMVFLEKIPDTFLDHLLDYIPVSLVKEGSEPIWSWGFGRTNAR